MKKNYEIQKLRKKYVSKKHKAEESIVPPIIAAGSNLWQVHG